MPRPPTGFYDDRSGRYLARLGEISPTTGKRKAVVLTYPDGRPIAKGDEPAVADAVRRLLADRGAAEARARLGPTVAEVCRLYVAWQADQGASERTIRDHHYQLSRFCGVVLHGEAIGARPAASIREEDLWGARAKLGGPQRHLYLSVCACWGWAYSAVEGRTPKRLIPSDPFHKIARPKAGSRGEGAVVEWGDTRRMLRVARGWARIKNPADRRAETTKLSRRLRVLCLHLIASTGCRPYEAWQLRWDEVLADDGMIAISPKRDKGRRKGAKPRKARRFAVSDRLLRALDVIRRWPRSNPEWAFALDQRDTEPGMHEWFRWVREDLKPALAARKADLPDDFTSYFLRHSAATDAIQAGETAAAVADQLGNSAAIVERVYAHAKDRGRKASAERLAKARRSGGK